MYLADSNISRCINEDGRCEQVGDGFWGDAEGVHLERDGGFKFFPGGILIAERLDVAVHYGAFVVAVGEECLRIFKS